MNKSPVSESLLSPAIQSIKSRVQNISNGKFSDLRESVQECLSLMNSEIKRIKKDANGYPNGSIGPIVWLDGVSLAGSGQKLSQVLSIDAAFLEDEVRATGVWVNAVLSVCSHYHHMVGPAMIAYALVSERVGNIEATKACCNAVIKDFESVLVNVEEDGCPLQEGDEHDIALQSLKAAASKIIELDQIKETQIFASEIISRIDAVMLPSD